MGGGEILLGQHKGLGVLENLFYPLRSESRAWWQLARACCCVKSEKPCREALPRDAWPKYLQEWCVHPFRRGEALIEVRVELVLRLENRYRAWTGWGDRKPFA